MIAIALLWRFPVEIGRQDERWENDALRDYIDNSHIMIFISCMCIILRCALLKVRKTHFMDNFSCKYFSGEAGSASSQLPNLGQNVREMWRGS